MKIWLGEDFLGTFNNTADVEAELAGWRKANSDHIFYLYECQGEQYGFSDTWEEFLKDNIDQDIEVKIIAATPEMLRLELVDSTKEYLDRLVESIENLASQFYAGPGQSAWEKLSDFLEGLDFFCQAMELLNCSDFDREGFNRMLLELMQAIESKDIVTVADLLSYEWSGWLEKVKNILISPDN